MEKQRKDQSHVLEGMSVAGLLHSLDYRLVDAKSDGDTEEGKQQVGDDADDAECCQGEQQQHGQTKRQARLLGVPPVDKILNCIECRQIAMQTMMPLYCNTKSTFHSSLLTNHLRDS